MMRFMCTGFSCPARSAGEDGQRVGERERLLVERAPDDHPYDVGQVELLEMPEVVEQRDAAREHELQRGDLAEVTSLEPVLSGGIALLDDLRHLKTLDVSNVVGVIVGRALYEKAFTLADALAVFAG